LSFGTSSWGEFWNKFNICALIGLITTCASFIAIDCVKHISTVATQLEKNLLSVSKYDISALLADGSAIISTGVTNLIEERSRSMIVSAVFGGLLTYGIIHGFGNLVTSIQYVLFNI
jgi:hypothetical protein